MKKVIGFLGLCFVSFILIACSGKTAEKVSENAKISQPTELGREFAPYYENDSFTSVSLPDNTIDSIERIARKAPYQEEDVRADVDYILQAFYYENGALKREELLGKTDEELLEYLTDEMFAYLEEAYGITIDQKQMVELEGENYNFRDEATKRILATMRSLQTANQYEVTDLQIDGNEVTVTVELRSIDTYQYTVMLQNSPNYTKIYYPFAIKAQNFDKKDPEERATYKFYETVLMNMAVYELNEEYNYTVPLEHPARTYPLTLTFEYDSNGYLTVPEKSLLALTQVRVK